MEQIASENLKALPAYWRGKGQRPSRADIDATEIPLLLKNILIVDVLRAPLRFRYGLVGTLVTQMVGRDVTGREVDEHLYGDTAPFVHGAYKTVVDRAAPMYSTGHIVFDDGATVGTEVIMVPLFDADVVDKLLLGLDFPTRPKYGPERSIRAFQIMGQDLVAL